MSLPVTLDRAGDIHVLDRATGELVDLRDASDFTLASAAREIAELADQLYQARRAIGYEAKARYGVGTVHTGGHGFTIKEDQKWPLRATQEALARLLKDGYVTPADVDRAMPWKRTPDKRQLDALLGRLLDNPEAARVLAAARSTSPPSVRDVRIEAVEEPAHG